MGSVCTKSKHTLYDLTNKFGDKWDDYLKPVLNIKLLTRNVTENGFSFLHTVLLLESDEEFITFEYTTKNIRGDILLKKKIQ